MMVLALAVPQGFVSHPELAQRVQFAAATPVSVYCAPDAAAWQTFLDAVGFANRPGETDGFAEAVGGSWAGISPSTCAVLLAKIHNKALRVLDPSTFRYVRRPVTLYELGDTLFVLVHEMEHLKGITDENDADCAALYQMPQAARAFGIRKPSKLRVVMRGAVDHHRGSTLAYNARPC